MATNGARTFPLGGEGGTKIGSSEPIFVTDEGIMQYEFSEMQSTIVERRKRYDRMVYERRGK